MKKLKASEIKAYRDEYLILQNNLCALCNDYIVSTEAVFDHDHFSGQLRCVLHRGCNAFLGHIENNQKRNKIDDIRLTNILVRLQHYVKDLKPILHPTHRTPQEKLLRAKKRAKARRIKK